jgi:codanin-1
MTVYRSALSESESIATDTFLVLTCLGWLFEIPNVPNSVFFEFMKTYPTPDPSPALSSHTDTQTALVTRELLYICCPYLAGIRVILAEFAAGLQLKTSPIRKIKPIPAETDTPHAHITTHSQLQMRLQENFFRSHPPYLKQLCGSISERVADTGILLVQSQVIPAHTTRGLRVLADWITKTCSEHLSPDSSVNIEELFHKSEAIQTVAQVSEQTITSVLREATQFCKQHCAMNTQKAISSLLCDTISEQVMAVAVGIATDWAVHHCMKWTHSKLRDIVFQEVQGGFDRLRKAVRAGGKAHCSALSLNTSSSTPHHLPSPPVSHVFTPPTSNHMLLQNTPSGCSKSQSVFERHGDNRTQCPLTHFMELASSALKNRDMCPSTDRVQGITAATAGVKEFIASQVMVVDGGNSPLLLPRKVDTLLSTSVHLAALLGQ